MNYKIFFIIGKYPNISFYRIEDIFKVFIIILLYFIDINTSLRSRRTLSSRSSHARSSGTPQSTAWRSRRARVPWTQRRGDTGDWGEGVPTRQWPEVYDLCHTFLDVVPSQTTHGHERIARVSRAILSWPCVVWLAQRPKTCDKIWYLGPLPSAHPSQGKGACG